MRIEVPSCIRSKSQKPPPPGKPARKRWVAMRKTAKDRLSRTLRRLSEWCRRHRHDPLKTQHLMLVKKLNGHYGYYGIKGNFPALAKVLWATRRIWRNALEPRSQKHLSWAKMLRILKRFFASQRAHRSQVRNLANLFSEEPGAGILPARICGGPARKLAGLPDP
ncbi:MAG: hypothetical protein ABIY55_19130 [Kofleriaceae bacterium]